MNNSTFDGIDCRSVLVFSGHAIDRAGDLNAFELGDIICFERAMKIPGGHSNRSVHCFYNPIIQKRSLMILSDDLCVVSVYQDREGSRISDCEDGEIKNLSSKPYFIKEFGEMVNRKISLHVVAQNRRPSGYERSTIHVARKIVKIKHNSSIGYLCDKGYLYDHVHGIMSSELKGLVLVSIWVDGLQIPVSSVIKRCRRQCGIVLPWDYYL